MKLKKGINEPISNRLYHSDRSYFSSSQLKLILKDPEQFHKEHVLGLREPQEEKAVFDEGSLTHSLILEPEKVAEEFAFFEGWRKQGKDWETFLAENINKVRISKPQKHRVEQYERAYRKRPEAIQLLQGGMPEHTMTSEILGVPVKARADYINIEKGYIADIKTTGYPANLEIFRETIKEFGYQLSAALYCQIAFDCYKKLFDFYFVVISKSDLRCDVYKMKMTSLVEGHAMVNKALVLYKKCSESGVWSLEHVQKVEPEADYIIEEV